MILKGRLIGPIILLVLTIFINQIAIERGDLLDFSNVSSILINFVCLLSIFLTVKLLFFFPRKIIIDSERLIVEYPITTLSSSRVVFFDTIESYKLRSLLNFTGYYLQVNIKSKKNKKKVFVFNIKGRDLDSLEKVLNQKISNS